MRVRPDAPSRFLLARGARALCAAAAALCLSAAGACARGQAVSGLKAREFFSAPAAAALAEAAARGDVAAVRAARVAGTDVNAAGKGGMTPLLFAMAARSYAGMEALLAAGADPNVRPDPETTPLLLAAASSDPRLLRILLDHGGDPSLKDAAAGTPALKEAIMHQQWANMRLLVERGADVNAKDKGHATPVMIAASLDAWEQVAWLLEHGADPTIPRLSGGTVAYQLERTRLRRDLPEARWLERVRQLLVARGVKFPAERPADVRRRVFGIAGPPGAAAVTRGP
jgi:hypothetical protein